MQMGMRRVEGTCSQAQRRPHIAPQLQLGASGMDCDEPSSQGLKRFCSASLWEPAVGSAVTFRTSVCAAEAVVTSRGTDLALGGLRSVLEVGSQQVITLEVTRFCHGWLAVGVTLGSTGTSFNECDSEGEHGVGRYLERKVGPGEAPRGGGTVCWCSGGDGDKGTNSRRFLRIYLSDVAPNPLPASTHFIS